MPPPPLLLGDTLDVDYEAAPPVLDATPPFLLSLGSPATVLTHGPLPPLVAAQGDDVRIVAPKLAELNAYRTTPALLQQLPLDAETGLRGPLNVAHTAVDAAGNESPVVTIAVYISAQPVCAAPETLCDDGTCSQDGLCLPGASTGAPGPVEDDFAPTVDTTPPWIQANGDPPQHKAVLSPYSGLRVVETTVRVGQTYVDPGAAAVDNADGDLSAAVSAYGLKAVHTRAPTPPARPYIVAYNVRDAAGNEAVPKTRRVYVVCPPDSLLCERPGAATDAWYCSVSGSVCVDGGAEEEQAATERVVVRLLGPAEVAIDGNATYVPCSGSVPLATKCERGAEATDAVEGDLTQQVMACRQGYRFAQHGLQGCDLDTGVAGRYAIRLWVEDSATQEEVAVTRTVVVLETCAASEERCADGSCSRGGLCSAEQGGYEGDGEETAAPLVVRLRAVAGGDAQTGAAVVPYGRAYAACGANATPTPAKPCDTGGRDLMCIENVLTA